MKYLFLIFLVLLLLFPATSFAQTPSPVVASDSASTIATTSASSVNYFLPYPGLLPDNFLYPLKMARDGIIGFLISDPLKKAKFDVLQADKRVAAAEMLAEKGDKKQLVGPTLSKAANYFEEAIGSLQQARREGMETSDMVMTLRLSNKKHQEVVRQIMADLPKGRGSSLASLASRFALLGQHVNQLMPKK